MRTILLICMVSMLFSGPSTTGGIILKQPMGARQIALGGSFTGLADDSNAIDFNPAGIEYIPMQIDATLIKGLLDTFYGSFGFVFPLHEESVGFHLGSLGLSVKWHWAGNVEVVDLSGKKETKSAGYDFVFTFCFARRLILEELSLGLNAKYLTSTLVERYHAQSFAFDIGVLYRMFEERFAIGLALQNFGGEGLKYKSVSDPLPLIMRLGSSLRVPISVDVLTIILEAWKSSDTDVKPSLGVEYCYNVGVREIFGTEEGESIAIARIGYKFNTDLGVGGSYSLGGGYVFYISGFRSEVDFSFAPFGKLGSSFVLSWRVFFG